MEYMFNSVSFLFAGELASYWSKLEKLQLLLLAQPFCCYRCVILGTSSVELLKCYIHFHKYPRYPPFVVENGSDLY